MSPLPVGTTLLEASAGTGKTHTVANLVTRFVAEGAATLDQVLVITFGRAATQELRERVREHLVDAAASWPDLAGRRRVSDALSAFDSATIATTHEFCQVVLRSLGVAGDNDPGTRLVESLDDLVVEVVDDLYVARFGASQTRPPITRAVALAVARDAVGDACAVLTPAGDDVVGQARVSFAEAVRAELEVRKRRLGVISYDDLLSRLADALAEEESPARLRMRERWRVVLVDEFQDTDPVQWQVLHRAFDGHSTMVLIGDPKQAIYGFRGGDVDTYLTAAKSATQHETLDANWRADADLHGRLQVVLGGAQLGDPAIAVLPIEAKNAGTRLVGGGPSWRMRQVLRDGFTLKSDKIPAADARAYIAADCAADIARLLTSGATWDGELVRAGQVAVIVAKHEHGALVRAELHRRGVPAVVAGGGDVFKTPAAQAWVALLQAMDAPHRAALVRAAALTPFFGHRAAELDSRGESLTASVSDTLRGWALVLRSRGVAALLEVAEDHGLTPRVLGTDGGDRLLTDLRHIAQVLHDAQRRERWGLSGLLTWLHEERAASLTERPRRLESDAAAVQIMTIWASKGLQFPITYLPFGSDFWVNENVSSLSFHAPLEGAEESVRQIDVSGATTHAPLHTAELLGEQLRSTYVALTRAQSQVVTWWAPTANAPKSGIHRLIFGRQPGTAAVPDTVDVRDDAYATHVFGLLEQLGGPVHEVSMIGDERADWERWVPDELGIRTLNRPIDTAWRRTSYSGLIRAEETAAAGPAADAVPVETIGTVTSEPAAVGVDDEGGSSATVPPASDGGSEGVGLEADVVVPMAALPAGAAFGSLVHAVLEHADPQADDLEAEFAVHVREQSRWWPVDVSAEDLAAALVPVHDTPLGPLAGDLTLRDLGRGDRLCELDFEIPLTGGDLPRGEVRVREIAPLLRAHLPDGDPMIAYADRLESPALGDQLLRGYLSGSIDVIFRVPTAAGEQFVVADYKTNHLGELVSDYTPVRLAEAMLHSHYPLQAILYSVVLHRYLRWRLPGYDPQRHLGGVLYLYLRGMAGPATPTGVFSWKPPAAFVLAVSDLLDGVAGFAGAVREGSA